MPEQHQAIKDRWAETTRRCSGRKGKESQSMEETERDSSESSGEGSPEGLG